MQDEPARPCTACGHLLEWQCGWQEWMCRQPGCINSAVPASKPAQEPEDGTEEVLVVDDRRMTPSEAVEAKLRHLRRDHIPVSAMQRSRPRFPSSEDDKNG